MKKYYVAFLDILGFSELIHGDQPKKVREIFSVLEAELKEDKTEISAISVSDSILLYTPVFEEKPSFSNFPFLRSLLMTCHKLQKTAAQIDVWMRGGISYGDLEEIAFGTSKNIFGKGIIEAYKLEQEAAVPRIIVGSSVLKTTSSANRTTFLDSMNDHQANHLKADLLFRWSKHHSGTSFVNSSTESSFPILVPQEDCVTFVDYFSDLNLEESHKILSVLRDNLKTQDGSVFKKYIWVKQYFACSIEANKTLSPKQKEPLLKEILEL